tara:strand:- start:601 stop:825 length:225 start_codon:yes stop_codon:yes gene_type:complete
VHFFVGSAHGCVFTDLARTLSTIFHFNTAFAEIIFEMFGQQTIQWMRVWKVYASQQIFRIQVHPVGYGIQYDLD